MTQTLEAPAKSPYSHLWGGGPKEVWMGTESAPTTKPEQPAQPPLALEATDQSRYLATKPALPGHPASDEHGPIWHKVSGQKCNVWSAPVARVISL
ncbi:MAG: hypothetical protein WBP26_02590 [Candidatus Saccharimonadales bacterium]